jgi:hypothetical protein
VCVVCAVCVCVCMCVQESGSWESLILAVILSITHTASSKQQRNGFAAITFFAKFFERVICCGKGVPCKLLYCFPGFYISVGLVGILVGCSW